MKNYRSIKTPGGRVLACNHCFQVYRKLCINQRWVAVCDCAERSDVKNWEVAKLLAGIERLKKELKDEIDAFCDAGDWDTYHRRCAEKSRENDTSLPKM